MLNPNAGYPFAVANARLPYKNGQQFPNPKAVKFQLDFSAQEEVYVDFLSEEMLAQIEFIQSIFVDNSTNPNALVVETNISNQRLTIPPLSMAYLPILVPGKATFICSTTVGNFDCSIQFLNIPMPAAIWGVASPGGGGGGSSSLNSGTFTDASGTITAGGTSQALLAANANRKGLLIQNPDTSPENIYINFGAAATVSTAGAANSIVLYPGGTFWESGDALTTQAVNIISATTGTPFVAKELN